MTRSEEIKILIETLLDSIENIIEDNRSNYILTIIDTSKKVISKTSYLNKYVQELEELTQD